MRIARVIRKRLGLDGDGVRAAGDISSAFAVNVGEQGAVTAASTTAESGAEEPQPDRREERSRQGRHTHEEGT